MDIDDKDIRILLASVLSLSQQMVEASKSDEWQRVVDLEQERSSQLEFLVDLQATVDKSPELLALWRETITAIIDSDRELTAWAESRKDEIAKGVTDMDSSRKAVNAYLENLAP